MTKQQTIEQMQQRLDKMSDACMRMKGERDALLEACKAKLKAFEGKEYDPKAFDDAAELCRAAISKVERISVADFSAAERSFSDQRG